MPSGAVYPPCTCKIRRPPRDPRCNAACAVHGSWPSSIHALNARTAAGCSSSATPFPPSVAPRSRPDFAHPPHCPACGGSAPLVLPGARDAAVTWPEGNTPLIARKKVAEWAGVPGAAAQARGDEPHGLLQGPRDDRRRHSGGARGCNGGRMRVHRQHRAPRWRRTRRSREFPRSCSCRWARSHSAS